MNPVDAVIKVLYAPDAEVVSPDLFLPMCLAVNAGITIEEAEALLAAADTSRSGVLERLRCHWDDQGNRITPAAPPERG